MNINRNVKHLITDLDDTISDNCQPISNAICECLYYWLLSNRTLAIVTMQSFEEVCINVLNPLKKMIQQYSVGSLSSCYFFCCGGSLGYKVIIDATNVSIEKLYQSNRSGEMIAVYSILKKLDFYKKGDLLIRFRGESISLGLNKSINYSSRCLFYEELENTIRGKFPNKLSITWKKNKASSAHITIKHTSKATPIYYLIQKESHSLVDCLIIGDDFSEDGMDLAMCISNTEALYVSVGSELGQQGKRNFIGKGMFMHYPDGGPRKTEELLRGILLSEERK